MSDDEPAVDPEDAAIPDGVPLEVVEEFLSSLDADVSAWASGIDEHVEEYERDNN